MMILTLLLVAILFKLAFEVLQSIRTVFFHPLSKVPGPWYAALSDWWLTTHAFRFKHTGTIHELFEHYGPVVRVGPNKIAFCDADVMRDIYLVHKFEKSSFYTVFKIGGIDQAFGYYSLFSPNPHPKASGAHYTAANVALLQREIQNRALDLVERILFSDWAWATLCQIPHKRWNKFTQCAQFLEEFVGSRIKEFQHQINMGKEFEEPPFVYRLLQYRNSLDEALPLNVVVTESVGHLIAGTETTSTTLSYFLWQLSCSSDVMQRLQTEIDNIMPDPRVIPDLSVLQNLKYLNAFILEGLRMHSVITGPLERVVPPTMIYNLMGYSLPPGTVVATQSWSVHRDPRVFPFPDKFDPDRWLDDSELGSADRAAHTMPFGLGTRICAGQHLAQAVLRISLVPIVRNFTIWPDSTTTNASMKMKHGLPSRLQGIAS
ncbi:cytochrome P450 [Mycena latifolia]|nr:cytochrome P450 [Mycena latifolia]